MGMCWVKKCMEYEVESSRPRGRPKRTWSEVLQMFLLVPAHPGSPRAVKRLLLCCSVPDPTAVTSGLSFHSLLAIILPLSAFKWLFPVPFNSVCTHLLGTS